MNNNYDFYEGIEMDDEAEREFFKGLWEAYEEEVKNFEGVYIPNMTNTKRLFEAVKCVKRLMGVTGGEVLRVTNIPQDRRGSITAYTGILDFTKKEIQEMIAFLSKLDIFCITPLMPEDESDDSGCGLLIEACVTDTWHAIPKGV